MGRIIVLKDNGLSSSDELPSNENVFMYDPVLRRIFGPMIFFPAVPDRMVPQWRRGLPLVCLEGFPCPEKDRILRPSEEQEILLGLQKQNQPQKAANLLEFRREKDYLRTFFHLQYPQTYVFRSHTRPDWDRLKGLGKDMKDLTARLVLETDPDSYEALLVRLKNSGRTLWKILLGRGKASERLLALKNTAITLILPQDLWNLPVEFMYQEGFFCLEYSVARSLLFFPDRFQPVHRKKTFALCAGPGKDRSLFHSEQSALLHVFLSANIPIHQFAVPSQGIFSAEENTCLHYSGHGKFHQGRFLLSAGTGKKQPVFQPAPGIEFVFIHACNDKFFTTGFSKWLRMLFEDHLKVWIGSVTAIPDSSGRISGLFYKYFLKGIPAGEALQYARKKMYKKKDPTWAGLCLAGDPLYSLHAPGRFFS